MVSINYNTEIKVHRPLFKVVLNKILRLFQFWTKNKYIIISYFDTTYQNGKVIKDVLTGYGFAKVKHA